MAEEKPTVVISYGEDEYQVELSARRVKEKARAEDPSGMDILILENESFTLDALANAVNALPFMGDRRLVIVENPLSALRSKPDRERFRRILENVPPSTALLLNIYHDLEKKHWLLDWAEEHPRKAFLKNHPLPTGGKMIHDIQKEARERGGEIDYQAANRLSVLVDQDPRLASQELNKLLTYVNFQRPVSVDDVNTLTPDLRVGEIFEMVDAIGTKDYERALQHLHRQLREKPEILIFGMIVRQFRLLIQIKEIQAEQPGLDHFSISRLIHEHPFSIKKAMGQTRYFTMQELEKIYHLLAEVDSAMKHSVYHDSSVLLDLLIIALTTDLQIDLSRDPLTLQPS